MVTRRPRALRWFSKYKMVFGVAFYFFASALSSLGGASVRAEILLWMYSITSSIILQNLSGRTGIDV